MQSLAQSHKLCYADGMDALQHVALHISKYGRKHQLLYTASTMIFFWAIFDSVLMYMVPILLIRHGLTESEMGVIVGSASIAGALLDVLVTKYLKRTTYRRMYFFMLILSFLYLILLYGANTIWIYLVAMIAWGMYWDLYHFANYDFVSKTTKEEERSSSFGVILVFESLGVLLGPLIAGMALGAVITVTPFLLAGIMLLLSILFFSILIFNSKKTSATDTVLFPRPIHWRQEFTLWEKIGKQILPLLTLTFLIYITDAFIWTIGPIIALKSNTGSLSGLLITMYALPNLIIGWFVNRATRLYGKKKTALFGFLGGSAILTLFSLASNYTVNILIIGVAAFFYAFVHPALDAAYTDYIAETEKYEKEIQGITDFAYNIGWSVGPVLAGLIADIFGNKQSFTMLGIICFIVTLLLIQITPKKIHLTTT